MSTITAVRIPAEGVHIDLVEIDNGLESLQSEVGGNVEAIDLGPTLTLWVDEEGKLKGKPMNTGASLLAFMTKAVDLKDYIAGDVVITGGTDPEGEVLSIPQELLDDLNEVLAS